MHDLSTALLLHNKRALKRGRAPAALRARLMRPFKRVRGSAAAAGAGAAIWTRCPRPPRTRGGRCCGAARSPERPRARAPQRRRRQISVCAQGEARSAAASARARAFGVSGLGQRARGRDGAASLDGRASPAATPAPRARAEPCLSRGGGGGRRGAGGTEPGTERGRPSPARSRAPRTELPRGRARGAHRTVVQRPRPRCTGAGPAAGSLSPSLDAAVLRPLRGLCVRFPDRRRLATAPLTRAKDKHSCVCLDSGKQRPPFAAAGKLLQTSPFASAPHQPRPSCRRGPRTGSVSSENR